MNVEYIETDNGSHCVRLSDTVKHTVIFYFENKSNSKYI